MAKPTQADLDALDEHERKNFAVRVMQSRDYRTGTELHITHNGRQWTISILRTDDEIRAVILALQAHLHKKGAK
jgi:hypothetical protein